MALPPGQKLRQDFPRFGLPKYANRFPSDISNRAITLEIDKQQQIHLDDAFANLPRVVKEYDFHCVTRWTYPNANWGGVRFRDFYDKHIANNVSELDIAGAVYFGQDGNNTSLLLEDLLDESVLLADMLDGKPLSIEHGAPLRLIAPKHYGYKNLKHLTKMEFHTTMPTVKKGFAAMLDHPRARVSKEERGRWIPGKILRYIYGAAIEGTVKDFREAMDKKRAKDNLS